jgi:hypothetical protein
MRRATTLRAAALAVGIVVIGAGQAGIGRAAARERANTFSGSCKLSGTAVFDPPLTNTAQAGTQRVQATGTCSGTFIARNGRAHQLNDALVSWQTTEYTPNASCTAGTDSGRGKVTSQYGTIRFTISETSGPGVAAFTLKGAEGGSAAGQANISPSADPVAITQACAGAGLAEAPIDIQVSTTPSISG